MDLRTVQTHHIPVSVYEAGAGEPLVYLHGAGGLQPDDPFVARLAKRWRVIAPLLPGYGPSAECESLRTMLDITLHTWDVIDALGLRDPLLVGHSMGGMIAAEMAAVAPHQLSRLALIAPAGLWLDAHPIPDIFALLPYQMPELLFHDVEAGRKAMTAGARMDDPEWLKNFLVTNARQLGMAGKLLFPIPDRGLSERLYRVRARTLLVWGESDRLIVPAYASAWQQAIAGARLLWVPQAGHLAPHERPEAVADAIATLA
jgi:pimeloyl-ACP methyl ester carboxylesterase